MGMGEARQRSAMIAVIECWKRNKCLWDPTNPNWYSTDSRNKAYKSVLKLYRKMQPSATLLDLKKKLKNMKNAYKKEYKKVKDYKCTTGNEEAYVPKLWYYKHLLFLDTNGITRSERNTLEDGSNANGGIRRKSKTSSGDKISMVSQQTTQKEVLVQQQTQVSSSGCTKKAEQHEVSLNNANTPLTCKEQEWEVIAKSIGLQLKNLDSQQQDFAQKLISDIIFYGKRGKLSDSTTILLEPHNPSHLRASQYCDPLRTSWHSGLLSPQSLSYSPHTPSSSISPPLIISSQSNHSFLSTTSQKYLQQRGTQPAALSSEAPRHHTHVEQGPISVGVTASPGMKQEEIIICDNEDSNDYVFFCS